MKILVNPVFDWATCRLESAERVYDHDGPVKFLKGGSAPQPPDPKVVSDAQTASNQSTAQYQASLNAGNVNTPLGSSKYTSRVDPTTGATVYDQNISLTPDAQAQLDQELAQNRQLNDVAGGMLTNVGNAYSSPMDFSKLPGLTGSVATGQYKTGIDTSGVNPLTGAPNLAGYQTDAAVNGPDLVGNIDMNGLPELYGANDLEGARKAVQDALYQRQAQYLDPQYAQRENQMRVRMANQGITEGSEAWNNAMSEFSRDRALNYDNARTGAITGSGSEMQRLADIARSNRGQAFGERATGANFTNDARAQALAEALSLGNFRNNAAGLGNADAFKSAQFNNDTSNTQFGRAATEADLFNSATGAQNADTLRAAGFGNDARTQALQEALTQRNQPLNEFNALRGASEVQIPQFQSGGDTNVAPTDVSGNYWNNYGSLLNIWNAKQGASNGIMGGLMGLGGQLGSAAIMKSDMRLKKDIVHIRDLEPGVGWYEFSYVGSDDRHEGVIAQELERVDPAAVSFDERGFRRVDYDRVRARYGIVA
jgi:hypothetical protein